MDSSIVLGVLFLVAGILFTVVYDPYFSGRKLHPAAGTKLRQVFHISRIHDYLTDLAKKHTTFRLICIGRNEIYTADPAIVEHILGTNFQNYGKGEYQHMVLKDLLGDGIMAVDGDRWQHQRKLSSLEFNTKVIGEFSSRTFRRNAGIFAQKISEHAAASWSFDMQDLLMKATVDSIFKVGFGVELGTFDGSSSEEVKRFAKAFGDSSETISRRFVDSLWRVKRRLNVGAEAKLKNDVQIVDDFIYRLINCKRDQMASQRLSDSYLQEKEEDLLSRFLILGDKDPQNVTDRYVRDVILNFMVAGKDTTAGTLCWFFYMMCKHPHIQINVAKDIEDATASITEHQEQPMADFAENLRDNALEKMHYLRATLAETLRLYPALPMGSKIAFGGDVLPDGCHVRKGDMVFYLPYAMGRMNSLWGNDAEEFRPERWIQNGFFQPESPFKFTAFQAGPRICLGKELAYQQMMIFAAVLLHFFIFKLADENEEPRYSRMRTLQMENGLRLVTSSRNS